MSRRFVALSVAAVAGAALTAGVAPAGAASAPTVSFATPRIVDPIHVYGEPDIAVNPKTGAIHASGPQGTGVQRSIWNVSVDDGNSFRIAQSSVPPGATAVTDASGLIPTKSGVGGGGGDTEIQFSRGGQAFFTDQAGLACYTSATTKDDGATISSAPTGCSLSGSVDREWIAVYDPRPEDKTISAYTGPRPMAYQSYSGTINAQVDMTTDGINWTKAAGQYGPDMKGVPVVDQHSGDFLAPAGGNGNGINLAIGTPNATGALTFTYQPAVPTRNGGDVLFPVLTEDHRQNLYLFWIDDTTFQAHYAWAPVKDHWAHWSAPVQISRPPSMTNIFPWAAAGGYGVLDTAWYGTSTPLSQLGSSGPSARLGQKWDVYFAQITNAASNHPHIEMVKATPHPMHYGDICLLGTACITAQGNRNMADFFKVAIDRAGRARIIYTDSSNRLSQTLGNDTGADHAGAALDTIVTQNTGVDAWTGKKLAPYESTAPLRGVSDPANDNLLRVLGGSPLPGGDIRSISVDKVGSDLEFTVKARGTLAAAATAAKTPFAQIVIRWQFGDTLYHVGVEQDAAGANTQFWSGTTQSVDLCSVSGCKPNYLTYNAPPLPGATAESGQASPGADGLVAYSIRVPLSHVGNPADGALLEELMAFSAVSPSSMSTPLDNARAFADAVPLEIDGTRTFNYRVGMRGATPTTASVSSAAGQASIVGVAARATGSASRVPNAAGRGAASSAAAVSSPVGGLVLLVLAALGLLMAAGLFAHRRRSAAVSTS